MGLQQLRALSAPKCHRHRRFCEMTLTAICLSAHLALLRLGVRPMAPSRNSPAYEHSRTAVPPPRPAFRYPDKGEGLLREEANALQFMGWMMACSYSTGAGRPSHPVVCLSVYSIIGAYRHPRLYLLNTQHLTIKYILHHIS